VPSRSLTPRFSQQPTDDVKRRIGNRELDDTSQHLDRVGRQFFMKLSYAFQR
jgi:hypothetical protein